MSFARGERVHFDFDSGKVEPAGAPQDEAPPALSAPFVGDILERTPATANPPTAPAFKTNTAGFPTPKKRTSRLSAFKQQRTGKNEVSFTSQANEAQKPSPQQELDEDERSRIDLENQQRLAEMSPEEIEQERNDLLSALSPSLIQRLLARGNIDEGSNERDLDPDTPAAPTTDKAENKKQPTIPSSKKVSFKTTDEPSVNPSAASSQGTPPVASAVKSEAPSENDIADSGHQDELPSSVHFPKPSQPPDLDPNSPSFLDDLHKKYFPNLPYDPSALSWMTPIDYSDTSSPYHPSQTALNATELRFNFKGTLLPPSKAREIPVTEGLHHHADAPEAAGYTIPELSILARSAVAAQRCVAYQTLGRILYRLGIGEYGEEKDIKREVDGPVRVALDPNHVDEEDNIVDDDDAASAMATGLWNCIEEGKVIETMTEEAAKQRGHLTAQTFAQEALWNWRRGGGRKRKAV